MKISTLFITSVSLLVAAGNAFADKDKVNICHKGKTINISVHAKQAHLNHGDYNRGCDWVPSAVALFQCGGPDLEIISVSTSKGVPQHGNPLAPLTVGDSCSESIDLLINHGYTRIHANSVYDATLTGVVTDYGYTGPRVRPVTP